MNLERIRKIGEQITVKFLLFCFGAMFLLLLAQCNRKPPTHPVAIIGMDGLEWRIVRSMIEKGELPNLKKILEHGVYSEMETLEPMLSPAIWTTIATGVSPEVHGITWFMVKDSKGNMIPVTSAQRKVKALWNILTEEGKTTDVIGWWASWPAEKIKGRIVSDHMGYHIFGIQSEKVETDVGNTYPEKLNDQLSKYKVDPFSIPLEQVKRYMKISDLEYNVSVDMKALCARPEYRNCLYCLGKSDIPFCHLNPLHHFLRSLATLETFTNISIELLKQKQPDLFMVYFEWVDVVGHQYMKFAPPKMDWVSEELFAKYGDVMRQTYIRQDEALGELMAVMSPDTNIFIMSDHGFLIGDERLKEEKFTTVGLAHHWHHAPAFLAMAGPDIRKNGKEIKARVHDITPTVLALLGLPIEDYIEGKVLSEAIEPAFLQKFPIKRIRTKSKERKDEGTKVASGNIDPQIKEHLQALGYIGNVDDTGLEMNRVSILMEKKKYDEAFSSLEEMISQDPSNIKAIQMLCDISMQAGKFQKAVQACSRAGGFPLQNLKPEGRPIFSRLYANWGLALLNLGDVAGAFDRCTQAINIGPRNFLGYFCLGRIAELQGNLDEAIKKYAKTIELNPRAVEAYNNLGNCYLNKKSFAKAHEYYRKSLEVAPKNPSSHHNAGVALMRMGKLKEAEAQFKEALSIKPDLIPSLVELSHLLVEQKRYDEAIELLKRWASLQPANITPLIESANIELTRGNKQSAIEYLRRAQQISPQAVSSQIKKYPQLEPFLNP